MRTLFLCLAALACTTPVSWGQDDYIWELPMTRDSGVSARALGMGNAYLAISDDGAALRFNPAGLARVNRVEFAGSLIDVNRDTESNDNGNIERGAVQRTRVSLLTFVYPFPTYRGSMVIALGYAAPWVADRVTRRTFTFADGPTTEETYESRSVGEWSFGYAVDMSPHLSLGFRTSWINGSYYRESSWYRDTSRASRLVTEFNVGGFTASFGALARVTSRLRMGLTLDLPRWINWSPLQIDEEGSRYYLPREYLTYPFSIALGSAYTAGSLLLALDARFTDWPQMDYQGSLRYDDGTGSQSVYRRTWDLHLGAEYLLDLSAAAGLRLRAGYAREPIPYGVMLQEMILGETANDDVLVYRAAHFDPERWYFTLGAGVLLQESITLDLAYAHGTARRSVTGVSLDENGRRLMLSVAFRLQ